MQSKESELKMCELDENINSLLTAISLTQDSNDIKELKRQLQATHNQILISEQKHKNNVNEMKRLRQQILESNRERIKMKKQLFDLAFQRDLAENNVNSLKKELLKLKNELKLKNVLFTRIESEKKKMSESLNNSIKPSFKRSSSEKDINILSEKTKIHREMSVRNNRKLLNNGLVLAYNTSKASEEIDKTIVLQRLLLSKCKELTEKQLILEELEKQNIQMKQQMDRLRQTKYLAQLLTNARHKLNMKANQLNTLREELISCRKKMAICVEENGKLKQKLSAIYDKKI